MHRLTLVLEKIMSWDVADGNNAPWVAASATHVAVMVAAGLTMDAIVLACSV